MPPRKAAAPEPEQIEEPETDPAVETDTVDEPVEEPATEPVAEPETEDAAEPGAKEEGGKDLGLNPGEEIIAQRTDDLAILWAVTNFGRKLRIDPDGNVEVVTGPPLDVILPPKPIPSPATVTG